MRLDAINAHINCLNLLQERLLEKFNKSVNEESKGLEIALTEIRNLKFDLYIKGLDSL